MIYYKIWILWITLQTCFSLSKKKDLTALASLRDAIELASTENPGSITGNSLTEPQKEAVLQLHNAFRSMVKPQASNMLKMQWDKDLEKIATDFASKCIVAHNPDRHKLAKNYDWVGENIAWGTGTCGDKDCGDVYEGVKRWFSESKSYNYLTGQCSGKCTLYTQMVWWESNKLGCGAKKCGDRTILVCNYAPGGNYVGQRPYKTGKACADCPVGLSCEDNLCVDKKSEITNSEEKPEVSKKDESKNAEARIGSSVMMTTPHPSATPPVQGAHMLPAGWNELPVRLTQIDSGIIPFVWGMNGRHSLFILQETNQLTPVDGTMHHVTAGQSGIWTVGLLGNVFFRKDVSSENLKGSSWEKIPGNLKQIDSGPSGVVWGVNRYNRIFCRIGIEKPTRPEGTGWMRIEGNMKYVSCGEYGCWAVNKRDNIYFRVGISDSLPQGTQWTVVPGKLRMIESGPGGVTVGLSDTSDLFVRAGVIPEKPEGTKWLKMDLKLAHVTVGDRGIMGILPDGTVVTHHDLYSFMSQMPTVAPTDSAVITQNLPLDSVTPPTVPPTAAVKLPISTPLPSAAPVVNQEHPQQPNLAASLAALSQFSPASFNAAPASANIGKDKLHITPDMAARILKLIEQRGNQFEEDHRAAALASVRNITVPTDSYGENKDAKEESKKEERAPFSPDLPALIDNGEETKATSENETTTIAPNQKLPQKAPTTSAPPPQPPQQETQATSAQPSAPPQPAATKPHQPTKTQVTAHESPLPPPPPALPQAQPGTPQQPTQLQSHPGPTPVASETHQKHLLAQTTLRPRTTANHQMHSKTVPQVHRTARVPSVLPHPNGPMAHYPQPRLPTRAHSPPHRPTTQLYNPPTAHTRTTPQANNLKTQTHPNWVHSLARHTTLAVIRTRPTVAAPHAENIGPTFGQGHLRFRNQMFKARGKAANERMAFSRLRPSSAPRIATAAVRPVTVSWELTRSCCAIPDSVCPIPKDCIGYIECRRYHGNYKNCERGKMFNPITNICDYPRNVDCESVKAGLARPLQQRPSAEQQQQPAVVAPQVGPVAQAPAVPQYIEQPTHETANQRDEPAKTVYDPAQPRVNAPHTDDDGVLREVWFGLGLSPLLTLLTNNPRFPTNPDEYIVLDKFEAPPNAGDGYGQRLSTYYRAPQTGEYIFYMACDNECELWISPDTEEIHSNLILELKHGHFTSFRQWHKYPDEQTSRPIYLSHREYYFIESFMKEGSGGDDLSIGVKLPNGEYDLPIAKNLFLVPGDTATTTSDNVRKPGQPVQASSEPVSGLAKQTAPPAVTLTNPLQTQAVEMGPQPGETAEQWITSNNKQSGQSGYQNSELASVANNQGNIPGAEMYLNHDDDLDTFEINGQQRTSVKRDKIIHTNFSAIR